MTTPLKDPATNLDNRRGPSAVEAASPTASPYARAADRMGSGPATVVLATAVVLMLIGAFTTPEFLTVFNTKVILRSAAFVGIMAVGLTFVTISGNFFLLSMEETAAMASVVFASLLSWGWSLGPALLVTLLLAIVVGAVQGGITGLGANPIIVTLGAAGVIFGVASAASDNQVIQLIRPHPGEWLGTGQFLSIPSVTWAFIIVAVLADVTLRRTSFGRATYLVGANKNTAEGTGLRAPKKAVQVFAVAAVAGAIVGILFTAQISQGHVNLFSAAFGLSGSVTISAIAAVLVGGNDIFGGFGSVLRSVLGALFISVVDNMMVLRGYESGLRILFVGLAVIVGVSLYAIARRGEG